MDTKSSKKIKLKTRFLYAFLPLIITHLQVLLNFTFRKHWIGKDKFESFIKVNPSFILGLWHSNALYSPLFNRDRDLHVMISNSKDGEYIARCVTRFGNKLIRGSSSKNAKKALRQAVKALQNKMPIAITPDGPRGPAFKLKEGIIFMASLTQTPIIPFHYEADKQWLLTSWDKHRVPKPFAKIFISYGEPIYIPRKLSKDDYGIYIEKVEKAMTENMTKCQKLAENFSATIS